MQYILIHTEMNYLLVLSPSYLNAYDTISHWK